jgi:hypothetical protein
MNEQSLRNLYLDLIKRTLAGLIYEDPPVVAYIIDIYRPVLQPSFIRKVRELGRDAPSQAHTAIGLRRLDNLQQCIERVLVDGVPGDLMETGVYRGGACIFMRAVLKAYGVTDRLVWLADSFAGMPTPDLAQFPIDAQLESMAGRLVVPLETVQRNFTLYKLLDDQVRFIQGWFSDTLPTAPVQQLAVLRLDGDLYESTWVALTNLYPKLSPGGFLIVDDWILPPARQAVEDYRQQAEITAEIHDIDGWSIYWRK